MIPHGLRPFVWRRYKTWFERDVDSRPWGVSLFGPDAWWVADLGTYDTWQEAFDAAWEYANA